MSTTPDRSIDPTMAPRRRRHLRRRIASLAAAAVAIGGLAMTTAQPVAAAKSATVCFTMASQGGVANYFPAWNVRVEMLYWDGRSWANAGSGYVRYTNSSGCVFYPLSNLLDSQQFGAFTASGRYYDWSGQYVAFRVRDVQTLRTFSGMASQYLTPGQHTSTIRGTVYCAGITCP